MDVHRDVYNPGDDNDKVDDLVVEAEVYVDHFDVAKAMA